MTAIDEGYDGPAVIHGPAGPLPVRVRLAGRFEPVDGRYHWGGRVAPDEAVAGLLRRGHRAVTIQVDGGTATAARLSEVDPWGGVRVVGTGSPPWTDDGSAVEGQRDQP
jgi:hypothetical protein